MGNYNIYRNLLTEGTGFHRLWSKRDMPSVKLSIDEAGITTKIISPGKEVRTRNTFTLADLGNFWIDQTGAKPSSMQEVYGSFEWLLDRYSLLNIVYSIEDLENDIERGSNRRHISPFDLKEYLKVREEEKLFVERFL